MDKNDYKSGTIKNVLHAKLAPVCFSTLLALGMVTTVQAAVQGDGGSNQPGIHTGANGATVIDINKAGSDGVSHNTYSDFSVDKNGVVLNNSGTDVNTQIAGSISGNANMAGGGATVILNEVTSSNPSQLNGMVEVAGKSAQVIIANPSGITCDGCGFINTDHVTLATGTVTYDEKGLANGMDIKKGEVAITGKGMDTSAVKYTDILARSVKVNAELKANSLKIVAGANHLSSIGQYNNSSTNYNVIAGEGKSPDMALDVSSLGAMYANKIYMQGTETGVGVRLDHTDLTANNLIINNAGEINNIGGTIQGRDMVQLAGSDVINQNGKITSNGNVQLHAAGIDAQHKKGTVDNTSGVIESSNVSVDAPIIKNVNGTIHASQGVAIDGMVDEIDNSYGTITSDGNLHLDSDLLTNSHGKISGKSWNDTINTRSLNNDDGLISEAYSLNMQVKDDVSNRNGIIHSDGALSIMTDRSPANNDLTLDNTSGTVSAGKNVSIDAGSYLSDDNSRVTSDGDISITTHKYFQNAGLISAGSQARLSFESMNHEIVPEPDYNVNTGTITANVAYIGTNMGRDFNGKLDNQGTISASKVDLSLEQLNNSGTIRATDSLNFNGTTLNNVSGGQLQADGDISITAANILNDESSVIKSNRSISRVLVSGELNNAGIILAKDYARIESTSAPAGKLENSGTIEAKDLTLSSGNQTLHNTGTLTGYNAVTLGGKTIINDGVINSKGSVNLNAVGAYGQQGDIFNNAGAEITGAQVSSRGKLTNNGKIIETAAKPDNGGMNPKPTPDNGGRTPKAYPYGSPTQDGPDSATGGVWIGGNLYHNGDSLNGQTISSIVIMQDNSFRIMFETSKNYPGANDNYQQKPTLADAMFSPVVMK